jgi:ribosomal protein L16 Arg81 hydroxylase
VLQISGRKRWKVYKPTIEYPSNYVHQGLKPPQSDPLLDIEVSQGDLLYLPQGYWHEAEALQSASMHISFVIRPKSLGSLIEACSESVETDRELIDLVIQKIREENIAKCITQG